MRWVLPRLYLHDGSQDEKPSFATAELTGRIMRVDVEVSLSSLGAWFKAFGLLHLARRLTLVGSSGLKMAVGERRLTTKVQNFHLTACATLCRGNTCAHYRLQKAKLEANGRACADLSRQQQQCLGKLVIMD